MQTLFYRAKTATGDAFDIKFPLRDDTHNATRIAELVTSILRAIDDDLASEGATSNGDVLQAAAMALAIRSRIILAPPALTGQLAADLLDTALSAVAEASAARPD
ncbi:MAG: hypothetical protein ACFHX7_21755 [Pseudomonadota bacterium]